MVKQLNYKYNFLKSNRFKYSSQRRATALPMWANLHMCSNHMFNIRVTILNYAMDIKTILCKDFILWQISGSGIGFWNILIHSSRFKPNRYSRYIYTVWIFTVWCNEWELFNSYMIVSLLVLACYYLCILVYKITKSSNKECSLIWR